ncbi:hypothetical protein B0H10DRAFT_2035933, partial [Mycena sp. CBHHK59/15]
ISSLTRTAIPIIRATTHARRSPAQKIVGRRFAHAAEYNNMPFDYSNSRKFAIKFFAFTGFGFALPFVAVGWQWYKPGGYKNS